MSEDRELMETVLFCQISHLFTQQAQLICLISASKLLSGILNWKELSLQSLQMSSEANVKIRYYRLSACEIDVLEVARLLLAEIC